MRAAIKKIGCINTYYMIDVIKGCSDAALIFGLWPSLIVFALWLYLLSDEPYYPISLGRNKIISGKAMRTAMVSTSAIKNGEAPRKTS